MRLLQQIYCLTNKTTKIILPILANNSKESLSNDKILLIYPLQVATLLITPLMANKYFILASIPATCSVLLAPLALLAGHLIQLSGHPRQEQHHHVALICLPIAAIFKLCDLVAMPTIGMIDNNRWQEVLSTAPLNMACWGILYSLLQCTSGNLYKIDPIKRLRPLLVATLATICDGILAAILLVLIQLIHGTTRSTISLILSGSLFWFTIVTCLVNSILVLLNRNFKISIIFPPSSSPPTTMLYKWLLALFWGILLVTNLLVVRWTTLANHCFTLGMLSYPLTFLLTDIITETYGKASANYAISTGFLVNIFMTTILILISTLPTYSLSPATNQSFQEVFSFTPGITIASMAAYLAAQYTDIYLFELLRNKTKRKHLWLRNNVATMTSQLIDTIIFSLFAWILWPAIAPTQMSKNVDTSHWFQLSINEYVGKCLLALLDTPLVYLALYLINPLNKKTTPKILLAQANEPKYPSSKRKNHSKS